MQEMWIFAGASVLIVGMIAGYFVGFRHGTVAGELRALKSMRSSRRGESRSASLSLRDEGYETVPSRSRSASP